MARFDPKTKALKTQLAHLGRNPDEHFGFVNPPVIRASTVLFENTAAMEGRASSRYSYGLTNTPLIEALTDAITALEDAAGTVLVPSGLAAVTLPILAAAEPGDQILIPDNVYWPTRRFADETLTRLGMRITYYDPLIGADIRSLFEGKVGIVFLEAPGSNTFEMPDIPALVDAAREAGAVTMLDNTWATPLIYKPVPNGIDYSIQAGTKYFGGHADVLIGSVAASARVWPRLKETHRNMGLQAGTEEIFLTLRGLRSMGLRLAEHEKNALEIAQWLKARSDVARVLHPALPDDPGHAIWKRDFGGRASGLFGFELAGSKEQAARLLDSLKIFGLGFSWGGFESLAALANLGPTRTATPWSAGPVIRLQIGLEEPKDLMDDLDQAFRAAFG
ncbi:MAG: cystathionine beta-lyase [Hyphomicrobiaceae bacterium]|nr:cystathionine beta-lyase [Hyphomicrobiaceae bacterium]